tara:strand:+ start:5223 stop:5720 length:498 start_codon:yes stop_codon:yes gene_type:complete
MKYKTHMNYDNTKKMLNTLRNLTESAVKKGTISEQEEKKELKDNVIVVDGVEVRLISTTDDDLEVNENQKKVIGDVISNFGTQVSDLGDLRPGVTIQSNQVRLDGNLPDVGLDFVIIAGESKGTYLNTAMLKVNYDLLESIQKLLKFEDVFADAMNDLISQRRIN